MKHGAELHSLPRRRFRVYLLALLSSAAALAQTAATVRSVQQLPAPFPEPIRLLLPPRLYAVPGIEMNVYFDNVCLAVNPANYVFDVTCAKGKQQVERWTFVPAEPDVGQFPFVLEVRDEANRLVARAESVLQVVPRKAGAGVPVSVLTIGDSLTHAAVYPAHLLELCETNDSPRITLVGHVPDERNPSVRIEGYGGWTAQRFATFFKEEKREAGAADWKAWNASGSPFLYADGQGHFKMDFARYCQAFNGGRGPDFVTILLGCNDNFGAQDETIDASIDAMFTYYDKLVEMVHQVRKETKVGVLLLVPPAGTQDAFAANYQCGQTRWQYKRNQQRVVERMIEKYGNREAEAISVVPANVNLDCMNNYPVLQAPRNSETKTEGPRLNNGVHPSAEGYRQIGDTLFCWIKAQLAATPVSGR